MNERTERTTGFSRRSFFVVVPDRPQSGAVIGTGLQWMNEFVLCVLNAWGRVPRGIVSRTGENAARTVNGLPFSGRVRTTAEIVND